MKLTTPISEILLQQTAVDTSTKVVVNGTIKVSFAELQQRLLNDFHSTTRAASLDINGFVDMIDESIGTVYNHQRDFMHKMHEALEKPNARISISSARQVGTSTGLLMIAYYEMLRNPHQNIVMMYPNARMASTMAGMFSSMVSLLQKENGLPKIFAKVAKDRMTTPMGGNICFLTSGSPGLNNLRGRTISKLFIEHPEHSSNRTLTEDAIMAAAVCQADLIFSGNTHCLPGDDVTHIDRARVSIDG